MPSYLPDFEALAIFARIVEHGSFSAAAESLGLSRPTVSKAITRLEQTTGTTVFNRTSRQLSVTDSGRRILTHAMALIDEAESAEAVLRQDVHHPHGLLKVTAPTSFGLEHVAPLLPAFLEDHPDVHLDVTYSDEHLDLINKGYDVAVRIAAHPSSSLRALHICQIPLLQVAAPSYLQKKGTPRHPHDLVNHDGLAYTRHGRNQPYHATHEGMTLRLPLPKSRYAANNAEALIPALLAGLGIGIFPKFMISRFLEDGSLTEILPEWSLPGTDLCLLTSANGPRPAKTVAFLKKFSQSLREKLS